MFLTGLTPAYIWCLCERGPLAQLVEQRPFKAWVTGSIPVRLNGFPVAWNPGEPRIQRHRVGDPIVQPGQDTGFSSRQQGFESPWGHHGRKPLEPLWFQRLCRLGTGERIAPHMSRPLAANRLSPRHFDRVSHLCPEQGPEHTPHFLEIVVGVSLERLDDHIIASVCSDDNRPRPWVSRRAPRPAFRRTPRRTPEPGRRRRPRVRRRSDVTRSAPGPRPGHGPRSRPRPGPSAP